MRWLVVYLAIGAITTTFLLLSHARRRTNPFIADVSEGAARYLLPILALIAAVVGWPLVAWLGIKSAFPGPTAKRDDRWDFGEFTVTPSHLRSRVSIEVAETQELVTDPLGAAPRLPFGFLNHRWRAFVETRQEGDELWSFEAPYMHTTRLGYALVRNGKIAGYFRSACRPHGDEVSS